MKAAIFTISRLISVILALYVVVALHFEGQWIRAVSMIVLLSLFLYYSYLTEKKNGFSLGYLYVFFIVYITNSAIACRYTDYYMELLTSIGEFGYWMKGSYYIYFITDICFYTIAILWLKFLKKGVNRKNVILAAFTPNLRAGFDIGALFLILIGLIIDSYEITLPIFAYFFLRLLVDKNNRIGPFLLLPFLFLLFPSTILFRYRLIGVVLPVIMALVLRHEDKNKVPLWKSILLTVTLIVIISLYGIISECYKLHYNFAEVMNDDYYRFYFFRHQFYRVFSIWIKLGGYIIHHVQTHGFFYGTTYIKSVINLFGGSAVSLPELCAVYDNATYAQPGLLVEGYANFGIPGAILNLSLVYFFMEWLHGRYIGNPTYINLFYAVIPFTQILLDGGTLNSAIYIVIILFLFNFPNSQIKKKTRFKVNRFLLYNREK